MTYLGCYNAYSQGLRDLIADGSVSIATCYRAALGRGYKLFSLQYGQQCWGGNDYVAATRDGLSSDCTVSCYGNSREVCGGGNVGSLYRIGAPSSSEAAAPGEHTEDVCLPLSDVSCRPGHPVQVTRCTIGCSADACMSCTSFVTSARAHAILSISHCPSVPACSFQISRMLCRELIFPWPA